MGKIFFHIDVNNAFLSWEAVYRLKKGEKLDLRTVASAVAGDPKKRAGIILAKSKVAKDAGIITGEPIFSALKKCPMLLIIAPNFDIYEKQSKSMAKIVSNYSDKVEQFSIDEFFIEYVPLLGSYMEVAEKIKSEIFEKLGFTVNIGISNVKMLAKMASDFEKPNKIHTLFKNEIKTKMWYLPIEELLFLGKQTAKKLRNIGIDTIGKLANTDITILKSHFKSHGEQMYNYAWGIDDSEIHNECWVPKSVSHSKTIDHDLTNIDEIYSALLDVTNETCIRLRNKNMKTKNIAVNLKTSNFNVYSNSTTLQTATNVTSDIFKVAKRIILCMYKGEAIRLIGVSLSMLDQDGVGTQTSIFEKLDVKQEKLDKTVDSILSKFNDSNIVTRGSLIHKAINNKDKSV